VEEVKEVEEVEEVEEVRGGLYQHQWLDMSIHWNARRWVSLRPGHFSLEATSHKPSHICDCEQN